MKKNTQEFRTVMPIPADAGLNPDDKG